MKVASPESGRLGVEVTDLDLRAVDDVRATTVLELVHRHKLVVLRGQRLTPVEYVAAARRFGTPQVYFQAHYHHPEHPEIFVSSNVPENGRKIGVAGTGRYWHTDYQFFPEPLPLTMVYPQRIPRGERQTWYIDMERVLDALPVDLRAAVESARGLHEAKWRYKVQPADVDKSITEILAEFGAITPTVSHPAVIEHPVTGARSLYLSEGFTVGLEGHSHEEGARLLARIFEFTCRPEHVHAHRWQEGDILFWDNRPLLHKASNCPPGEASVSYRIGVYDGLPFYVNGAPAVVGPAPARSAP